VSAFNYLRFELAVVGLALCTIALVFVLGRVRAVTERRLISAKAQWDEAFAHVSSRLTVCEARIDERVAANGGVPSEADDEEIAVWLESLRGLANSLHTSTSSGLALIDGQLGMEQDQT
jgi:hypothetical protein